MEQPALRSATYADVLAAPRDQVAELIGGGLYLQPRPAMPHGRVSSVLGMLLGPPFHLGRGGPGGWEIHDAPELHPGEEVLVPDLAGWRLADHPKLDLTAAHTSSAPNWVCEVLSPSTRGRDRVLKLPVYARAGVEVCWLVDPGQRTLEVCVLERGRWVLTESHHGAAEVAPPPFEAAPFSLESLWVPGASDEDPI